MNSTDFTGCIRPSVRCNNDVRYIHIYLYTLQVCLIRHLWLVTLWSGYLFILSHIVGKGNVTMNMYRYGWRLLRVAGGRPCNIITAFGFAESEVDVTKFSVVWPTWILFYIYHSRWTTRPQTLPRYYTRDDETTKPRVPRPMCTVYSCIPT